MKTNDILYPYKLTIAIPTYNRVQHLKKNLPQVVAITKKLPIEIIVSDNCSTDETQVFMEEFLQKNPQVRYYRRNENGGMDCNFLNCFDKAHGEYVLLLSDDDLLLAAGLKSLMFALEQSPVFVYLNTTGNLSNKKDGTRTYSAYSRLKEEGLITYMDKNQLLESMGVMITFISSLVCRTEYVRDVENKEQYIGTYFLQSHVALKTMMHDGNYIVNTVTTCAATPNVTLAYDFCYVWGKCYGDLLYKTAIESGFSSQVIDKIAYDSFRNKILDNVWYFRRTCHNEKEWDREALWLYVNKFPDLVPKYRSALACPAKALRCVNFVRLLPRRVKKIPMRLKQLMESK